MHTLKRLLVAAAVLLVFGAFSAFANGQGESANLAGTVSSIQPTGTNGQVNVVLTTKSGSYTVTVDQSVVTKASLQVGQNISLKGVLHKTADGGKSVDATEVEVAGKQYTVANKGATSGNGSSAAEVKKAEQEKAHKELLDKSRRIEKDHADKLKEADSLSHDKSSPDTSNNDATTPDTKDTPDANSADTSKG